MPKIVDHEERRAELAKAALRVAHREGVDALTVRAVAKEGGWSPGALSHYFQTKDDLLIAVVRASGETSTARIEACFERHTGRDLLEAIVLTVLPLDEERRGEWRLNLAYFGRAAEEVELARIQAEYYRAWRTRLRAAYSQALPTPRSRAEIDRGTDALMTLIQGLGVLGMFEPAGVGPSRQRQLVREHLEKWIG